MQLPMNKILTELEYDRGDGICKHLQDDFSCGIYETRPRTCRVPPNGPHQAKGCVFVNKLGPVSKERWREIQDHQSF
jgi:Fe-S-cluster containining protein